MTTEEKRRQQKRREDNRRQQKRRKEMRREMGNWNVEKTLKSYHLLLNRRCLGKSKRGWTVVLGNIQKRVGTSRYLP